MNGTPGPTAKFMLVERRPSQINWTAGKFSTTRTGVLTLRCDFSVASEIDLLSWLQIGLLGIDRRNQQTYAARLNALPIGREIRAFMGQRPERSYGPDFVDLWNLYHYVRTARPKTILELGSGLSSLVLGYALLENGAGQLYSLEPNEEWAKSTADSLPPSLRRHCEVIHSRSEACTVGGQPSVRFVERPLASPDMIYVDGAPQGACWKGAEDVHRLEPQLQPGTAVFIDGRAQALMFFTNGHSHRNWNLRTNMILLEASPAGVTGTWLGLDQFANSFLVLSE